MSPRCYRQLSYYQAATDLEVGGFGLVGSSGRPAAGEPYDFRVKRLWLMSAGKETSRGYNEIPAERRARLLLRLAKTGEHTLCRLWWHQHPCSGWSGTDNHYIGKRLTELLLPGVINWSLSLVMTPDGPLARYDQAGADPKDCVTADELAIQVGFSRHDPAWERQLARVARQRETGQQREKEAVPPALVPWTPPSAGDGLWDQLALPMDWLPYEAGVTVAKGKGSLDAGHLMDARSEGGLDAGLLMDTRCEGDLDAAFYADELEALADEMVFQRAAYRGPAFPCKRMAGWVTSPAGCAQCASRLSCFAVSMADVEARYKTNSLIQEVRRANELFAAARSGQSSGV